MTPKKTWLLLKICEVPDLSLSKYNTVGMRGMESIFEFHRSFLRQWYRKGILSGISIHLFYNFDPAKSNGEKMGVYLAIYGQRTAFANVLQLMKSSALLSVYHYEIIRTPDFIFTDADIDTWGFRMVGGCHEEKEWDNLKRYTYAKCCTLTKKECFYTSVDSDKIYYTVDGWEANQEGRLKQFYALMCFLQERMCVRFDLYPVEQDRQIKEIFRALETDLRRLQMESGYLPNKDYSIDAVLKSYDEIQDSMKGTPKFKVNIFAFGSLKSFMGELNSDNTEMLLDAIGAESIVSGDYDITTFEYDPEGPFMDLDMFSFLDMEKENFSITSDEKSFLWTEKGYEIVHTGYERNKLRFLTTLFTLEDVLPFFRLPILDDEDDAEIRKETAPKLISEGVFLGIDDKGYRVNLDLELLAKHAFIAGTPGSGKTNMIQHLASTLWLKHHIPFLIFEPAKKEYRSLLNQKGMEDIYFFSPNVSMDFPLQINPFEFPKGITVSEHIRQLNQVFEGTFPLPGVLPFILDRSIEGIYRDSGWKMDEVYVRNRQHEFPTMSMLYKKMEVEIEKAGYSPEARADLIAALQMRIGGLVRREQGRIFDVYRSTFRPEEWLEKPAIIELEALGIGPSNFMTLLICTLIRESLNVCPHYPKDHARHVIFIEEAHNLIGRNSQKISDENTDPKQAATEFIIKMLAEVRALKESIVIADQLPTVMADEVLKNTGLKIGLRITAVDDRISLCNTMSASEKQMQDMSVFDVGRALVFYEGLQKPFAMWTHEWLSEGDEAFVADAEERKQIKTAKSNEELKQMLGKRKSCLSSIKVNCWNSRRKIQEEWELVSSGLKSDTFLKLSSPERKKRCLEARDNLQKQQQEEEKWKNLGCFSNDEIEKFHQQNQRVKDYIDLLETVIRKEDKNEEKAATWQKNY